MKCPTVKELVAAAETGEIPRVIELHLADCEGCSGILGSLRDETEGLGISIGSLWLRERISCPHEDIMLAWVNGALDPDQADYIRFHLDVVGCPRCMSAAAECEDRRDRKAPERIKSALEKSLRSTAVFLQPRKKR